MEEFLGTGINHAAITLEEILMGGVQIVMILVCKK